MENQDKKYPCPGPWEKIEDWSGRLWAGNWFRSEKLITEKEWKDGNTTGNPPSVKSRYGDSSK